MLEEVSHLRICLRDNQAAVLDALWKPSCQSRDQVAVSLYGHDPMGAPQKGRGKSPQAGSDFRYAYLFVRRCEHCDTFGKTLVCQEVLTKMILRMEAEQGQMFFGPQAFIRHRRPYLSSGSPSAVLSSCS